MVNKFVKTVEVVVRSVGLFSTLVMLKGKLVQENHWGLFPAVVSHLKNYYYYSYSLLAISILALILLISSILLDASHYTVNPDTIYDQINQLHNYHPLLDHHGHGHGHDDHKRGWAWEDSHRPINDDQLIFRMVSEALEIEKLSLATCLLTMDGNNHLSSEPPIPIPTPPSPSAPPLSLLLLSYNDDDEWNIPDYAHQDTMDATWKAISSCSPMGKNQNCSLMTKSQTWNVRPVVNRLDSEVVLPSTPKWKELKKAMTFNDSLSLSRKGGLIRTDPYIGLDKFNKQVEDFIKKTKDKMRLERLQSEQQNLLDAMIQSRD